MKKAKKSETYNDKLLKRIKTIRSFLNDSE